MKTLLWTLLGVYALGFGAVLSSHFLYLPMVAPGLALLRAAVWPIFWVTGWPQGTPLPMD